MNRRSSNSGTIFFASALTILLACAGGSAGSGDGLAQNDAVGVRSDGVGTDDCASLCFMRCHSQSRHCFRSCYDLCQGDDPQPPPTSPPPSTVLVAGGDFTNWQGSPNTTVSAELFNTSPSFAWTGSLNESRTRFYMTVLDDGRVLAAGGVSEAGRTQILVHNINHAEVFTNGQFTRLSSPMHNGRGDLAGAHLNGGNVLLVGGVEDNAMTGQTVLNTAEIFQPATNTFVLTPSMTSPRRGPSATTVRNGTALTVLVAGGHDGRATLSSAELFDAGLQRFRPPRGSAAMTHPRWQHTATLLNNGKVLLAGGLDNSFGPQTSAELYDPVAETFSSTGSMHDPRVNHTATLLANGRVLIAGGSADLNFGVTLSSAEIYDPATGRFTSVAPSLRNARLGHTATLLRDNRVLIAGGRGVNGIELNTSELFDGTLFSAGPNLMQGRVGQSAVLLP